jgi:spore coat polysaccharide biosynthesis predicted glycosyltransferase SpsG
MAGYRKGNGAVFAICIESSHARGLGHLFRSLNLADALGQRGHAVRFIMNVDAVSAGILKARGHTPLTVDLADTASGWEAALAEEHHFSMWVDDRLDTSHEHAAQVKAIGLPLVTFDDRGSGAALADLHVAALAFDGAPLAGKKLLTGVDCLILNPAIAHYQRVRRALGSLLVTLGGSDTYGATVQVVAVLAKKGLAATVVVGPGFAHRQALDVVLTDAFKVLVSVPSMIEEMSRHDLAITGGGITPFEANAAGLPCMVVANEAFEVPVGMALERLGGSLFAGHHSAFDLSALDGPLPIERMSQAGMRHVGLGGAAKVVAAMEGLMP